MLHSTYSAPSLAPTNAFRPQCFKKSRINLKICLIILATWLITSSTGFCAKTAIYTWSAQNYFDNKQSSQWTFTWVSGTSGPLRCQGNGTGAQNWYTMITTAPGSLSYQNLQHGGMYSAEITYYIVTPTIQPAYFYIYARNTAGNQYDIWHQWNGDAGTTFRTLKVPLDLKTIPGGEWNVSMGMVGPGVIVLSDYVIYEGSEDTAVTATTNGAPASNTSGVTAAAGSAAVVISPPVGTGTYDVTGLVANSPSSSDANGTAFNNAITTAVSQGKHTITIPPGKYWMSRTSGSTKQSLNFTSRQDLTIDGQGSTFVFKQQTNDGTNTALMISGSSRLAFKNLNIDWDWTVLPLASLGKVSNLSTSGSITTCDFTFEDLDATQTEKVQTTAWGKLFRMDPTTLTRTGSLQDFALPSTPTLTRTGNVIHASFNKFSGTSPLMNGNYYLIRHADYGMAAIKAYNSNHILFENVNVYGMTGMGWIFGADAHHIAIKGGGVLREPGSRNPFTTSRDALHVMESQGYILLENATFTGAGDDLINIHDRCYAYKITVVDADTITLNNYTALQPLRLNNNDTIEFFNPDYSKLNGSATPVTRQVDTWSINGTTGVCTINFKTALPTPLSQHAILRNTRYNTTNVHIKGCSFYNANGHGILISSEGATLENNTFQNIYSTPLELEVNLIQNVSSPTSSWWEGDGATDVIIRDNYFDQVSLMGEFGGAVIYARPTLPCGPSDVKFFDRISITNNTFDRIYGPAVALNNSKNVIVDKNQINYSESLTGVTNNYSGFITARRSSNLALGGNSWINRISNPYSSGVVYDGYTSSVSTATNALFSFSGNAFEDFESYTLPASFTTGQTLGSATAGWGIGWKTASSYASTTGSILNTLVLDSGKRLNGAITTQSGKTATSATVARAFAASSINHTFSVSFRFRADTIPANARYVISDGQIASAAAGDSSCAWLIASVNGTWQFFDGAAGGTSTYIDTGIPVTPGGIYDFSITVDPVAHTWRASIDDGNTFVVKSGLHARASTFATDTGTAPGGRWLMFGVREVVSGTSVGTTGTFSLDSLAVEY